jgi:hypothetical protein
MRRSDPPHRAWGRYRHRAHESCAAGRVGACNRPAGS